MIKNVICTSKKGHGSTLFTVIPRKRPHSVAFYDARGDTDDLHLAKDHYWRLNTRIERMVFYIFQNDVSVYFV